MFSKDSIIPRKLDEFVIKKKNLLAERLNLIKNNRIQRYENYNNNFNTIEVESELYYNNPRQSNRQKDINSFRDMANESNIMEVSLKNGFNKLILSPIKKINNKIRLPTLTIRLPRETDMNIRKYSNTKVEEVEKKDKNDPFLGKINKKIKNTANIIKNTDKIVSDSRLDNNKLLVTSNSGKLAVIDYNLVIDNYNTKNQVIKLSKKNSATINTEEQNDKILQSLCKIINVKEIRSSRMKASRNILSKNILSKSQRDILKQRESILKNIKSTKTTIQATIN